MSSDTQGKKQRVHMDIGEVFRIVDSQGREIELQPDEARFVLTMMLPFIPRQPGMSDAYITATVSPPHGVPGPKLYCLTIEDGEDTIRLEIKYDKAIPSVTANIRQPRDYDYDNFDDDDDIEDDDYYGEEDEGEQ